MIEAYAFGEMRLSGRTHRKDLFILRGEVHGGWRRAEGHTVDARDLPEVLAARPKILVVGTGAQGRMEVAPALALECARLGIELRALPTPEAIAAFNALLASGEDAAGAFHLTC